VRGQVTDSSARPATWDPLPVRNQIYALQTPSRLAIGEESRLVHISDVFTLGDRTRAQRARFDGFEQSAFASGLQFRSDQIPHQSILPPAVNCDITEVSPEILSIVSKGLYPVASKGDA
jgi:hypothetical protein